MKVECTKKKEKKPFKFTLINCGALLLQKEQDKCVWNKKGWIDLKTIVIIIVRV